MAASSTCQYVIGQTSIRPAHLQREKEATLLDPVQSKVKVK